MSKTGLTKKSNKQEVCFFELETQDSQQEELKEVFYSLRIFYNLVLLELEVNFKETDFNVFKFARLFVNDVRSRLDTYKSIGLDILLAVAFKAASTFLKNKNKSLKELIKTDETFNSIFLSCKKCTSINFTGSSILIQNLGSYQGITTSNFNFSKKPKYIFLFKKNNKFFLGVIFGRKKYNKKLNKAIQPALFK